MEEFTFTPKTTKSFLSNRTETTNESSGGESVVSRLHRAEGCVTDFWSSPLLISDVPQSSPLGRMEQTDATDSTAGSAAMMSNRMEGTYHKRVEKMRARPLSEKVEREIRDRNFEAKEMEECTFRPQTHWGRQQLIKTKSKGSKITMEPAPVRARALKPIAHSQPVFLIPVKPWSRDQFVPKEIVVMKFDERGSRRTHRHPWESPPQIRKQEGDMQPSLLRLSPLKVPSLDGFETIAARYTPQGKHSNEIFQEIVDRAPHQTKRWRNKSTRAPDYGSV